jgi:hypothetical protein
MKIPKISLRPLGEIHDKDTQFTAFVKSNQEILSLISLGIIFFIIFYVVFMVERPREGTWRYAICKVFLERYTQYPPDLEILTAAEKQNSAQIGYLATNSYGIRESKLMECFYNTEGGQVSLNRVTIDRETLTLNNPVSGQNSKDDDATSLTPEEIMRLWTDQNNALENLKYPSLTFESFNRIIPLIISNEDLDRTMPRRLPTSLVDLKF